MLVNVKVGKVESRVEKRLAARTLTLSSGFSIALVVLLLFGGFAPAPLLAVRKGVVSALHRDESTIPSAH
mgnify:CR=1 FL=1